MTMAAKIEFKASAQFNPVFRPVNEWRGRYRILKGSAGSGKSVNIAQDYIAKMSDPAYTGANLLVVRKIEETNRDSTFAELQAAIYRMFGPYAERFWKVNLNPLSLECKITGNRIIFRGVKDQRQREKVKSITFKNGKLVWIWCEEATELLSEDVDILDDRLRGKLDGMNPNLYYQITMTFNPVSATHWIKARYFDKADPDVLAHHSTYKTNRFIDPAYYRRMERRKEEDPEGYRVYGLGEWGELGGLILTNFEVHDFKVNRDAFDAFYYGQDFGYILKNYGGQDLGEFIKDLKEHMAIKVTTDGGVDKLQADLNIDAVMAFLDKQRRDVYDFAAAVDTKDPDLGNASGTAINFRYMDLSSDCDSLATELKDTFQRLKLFIDVYLQIAGKGDFSKETFDIVFNMDLPVNETDVIQNAVASESLLSKRTILQNHPWVTDADEEMERIDAEKKAAMEEYGEGLFGDALGAGKGQNGHGDPVNGGGADGNE